MARVVYEKRDRIGYVTLNRPEALNAQDDALNDALWDVWAGFQSDETVDVAIVTGEIAATAEMTGVHLDTGLRKSCPFPGPVFERASALIVPRKENA